MQTKLWYKSKTILALLPIVLYYITKFTGVEISESELMPLFEAGTTVVLWAIAIYGRFVAKKEVK